MSDRIRIEDLANPVLTDDQRAAVEHGESQHVDLTVDSVLSAATEATGLDDFGPDDFMERLGLGLTEMDEDDERLGLGRLGYFGACVNQARNRLRIRDLLKQHPEILDIEIEAPVIVIGLPRSGTTNLVNLLAADDRFRSMAYWESQEPVPDPRESVGPDGVDPRWRRCEETWHTVQRLSPLTVAMHSLEPDHVHEDLELMLPDFTSYQNEWFARFPRWRDYLLSHDQTEHYAYMKTGLQILQWYKPRERWVLKCPQHLEQIGPLMATFPDATIVVTHRDPVSVVQSTITMLCYAARTGYRNTSPEWYRDYWIDRIERLLGASVRDRHLLPEDRTIDVYFHEYMADQLGLVRQIYDVAGIELTTEAEAQMAGYVEDHPRGKHGQVVYDLRRDFGITPEEARAGFDFYFDRFPVKVEVE